MQIHKELKLLILYKKCRALAIINNKTFEETIGSLHKQKNLNYNYKNLKKFETRKYMLECGFSFNSSFYWQGVMRLARILLAH